MNQPTFVCQSCGKSSLYTIRDQDRDTATHMKADPDFVETLTFVCRNCGDKNQIEVTHDLIVEIMSEAMETTDMSSVIAAALKMKKKPE